MIKLRILKCGTTAFILTALCHGALHAQTCLLHFTFDEGKGTVAHDTSGNACDGQIGKSASWSTNTPNGKGSSILLSGESTSNTDTVFIPVTTNHAALDNLTSFTFATWFNLQKAPAIHARIFDCSGVSILINPGDDPDTATIFVQIDGAATTAIFNKIPYNLTQWQYMALTWDGSKLVTLLMGANGASFSQWTASIGLPLPANTGNKASHHLVAIGGTPAADVGRQPNALLCDLYFYGSTKDASGAMDYEHLNTLSQARQ